MASSNAANMTPGYGMRVKVRKTQDDVMDGIPLRDRPLEVVDLFLANNADVRFVGPQNRAGYSGLGRLAESRGVGGPTRSTPVVFPVRTGMVPHGAPRASRRVGDDAWAAFEEDYYSRMVFMERPRADLADSSDVTHYEHS